LNAESIIVRFRVSSRKGSASDETECTVAVEKPTGVTIEEIAREACEAAHRAVKDTGTIRIRSVMEADEYANLPWKKSKNEPDLSTLLVTADLNPLERELYDRLLAIAPRRLHFGRVNYRLSLAPDRRKYFQRWTPSKSGGPPHKPLTHPS
jgi:hypothetical protein